VCELNQAAESFAVRVLSTDLRLHGRRFVMIEFGLAAAICVGLGLLVAVAALIRGTGWTKSAIAVIFFAGVSINSFAVIGWVRNSTDNVSDRTASLRDLTAFAAATLLPGMLAFSLRF